MIARLFILLPFSVAIPEREQFNIYEYTDDGYKISVYPPHMSDKPTGSSDHDKLLLNGVPTHQANSLQVDFKKDNFNRKEGSDCDPPYYLISRAVNSFILKLRFVTRGNRIRPINFPLASWQLTYLNDDESDLPKEKGYIRGRINRRYDFSYIALNKDIWEDIHKLDIHYIPPEWENLLLDANSSLPEIGPSIVLASTALEVFISHILNELAKDSPIPNELWDWINNRPFWLKNPDTSEQFDSLLKILLGISLKDNNDLWEAFKNLKDARNSFVHEGIASIGNNQLAKEDAEKLVVKASELIRFIKEKLPEKLHWPEFKYSIKAEFIKKIFDDKST